MPTNKKKIPLPWAHDEEQEVRQLQTLEYWSLSQHWHGRSNESITVMDALQAANDVLDAIDPAKRLAFHMSVLKENIISFGTKSKHVKYLKKAGNTNKPAGITLL